MKTEMVIGKYTLESLTNGMYSSPLDLYREYIQNAVDSIDEAVAQELISSDEARIDIAVNTESGKISIRDNGTGIPLARALQTLVDIGNSKKDQCRNRGFRGIGRLAGLGYCDSLTFITSSKGESYRTVVVYDADKLNELKENGITIDYVISHTSPSFCFKIGVKGIESWIDADENLFNDLRKERQAMDNIYEHLIKDGHPLKKWVYGHFHAHNDEMINNIRFITLQNIEYSVDIHFLNQN